MAVPNTWFALSYICNTFVFGFFAGFVVARLNSTKSCLAIHNAFYVLSCMKHSLKQALTEQCSAEENHMYVDN